VPRTFDLTYAAWYLVSIRPLGQDSVTNTISHSAGLYQIHHQEPLRAGGKPSGKALPPMLHTLAPVYVPKCSALLLQQLLP
jgi:hypothetical protein